MKRHRASTVNPFECLPDEIVLAIFGYLDAKSIKNFALSCKRPAAVLTTSANLLDRFFKLRLADDFWQDRKKVLDVISLTRPLADLELANIAGGHNTLTALFARIGHRVTKLRIAASTVDDFTLREILRMAPSLRELHLSEVAVVRKLPAINPLFMASLTRVTVHYCAWSVFRFVMRSQIHALSVKNYLDEGERRHLVDFLAAQFALRELTLEGTAMRALFQCGDVNDSCAFSLRSFTVDSAIGRSSDAVSWNVCTFLRLHDATLTRVEISGPHNELVTGCVLMNLDTLTELTLDVRGLPKSDDFYRQLETNVTLRKLRLRGFFFQPALVKAVLLKFPAIVSLELSDWSNASVTDLLQFVARNFSRLERLTITEIAGGECVKLGTLTSLTVQYIRRADTLMRFISGNERIEALSVGLAYIGEIGSLVEGLRGVSTLKFLSIGGTRRALKEVVMLMQANAPKRLETLELAVLNEERRGGDGGEVIRMNLPLSTSDVKLKFNMLI